MAILQLVSSNFSDNFLRTVCGPFSHDAGVSLHLGFSETLPHPPPSSLPNGCPIPLHLPAWPPVGPELVGLSGVGGGVCGVWIGKKWLSPCLINDPSVACPATLGPHVSTSVHAGRRALFWEEMVSAAHGRLTIKRKKKKDLLS